MNTWNVREDNMIRNWKLKSIVHLNVNLSNKNTFPYTVDFLLCERLFPQRFVVITTCHFKKSLNRPTMVHLLYISFRNVINIPKRFNIAVKLCDRSAIVKQLSTVLISCYKDYHVIGYFVISPCEANFFFTSLRLFSKLKIPTWN